MNSGRNRRTKTIIGAAIGTGAAVAAVAPAQAQDITVTNLTDAPAEGSLRGSIDFANANPGADRILFQSGLSGTIAIEGSLPKLTDPVTIVGPGRDVLRVDGQGENPLFDSEANLSISGLTIAAGSAPLGGNVRVYGADLSVTGSRISGGTAAQGAGGIMADNGHLTLTDSEVVDNKGMTTGGILVVGSATISGSTISGNEAEGPAGLTRSGGAFLYFLDDDFENTITDTVIADNLAPSAAGILAFEGDLTIDSSLFTGNEAAAGGVLTLGPLAGLGPGDGTYAITNSTIAGNMAGTGASGLLAISDDVTVESSTITGNRIKNPPPPPSVSGAGISQFGGQMSLRNSIVSGNSPDDLWTLPDLDGSSFGPGAVEGSFNLVGDPGSADFTATVEGSNISSTDPQLGPLADNGGPTETRLPAATSPVVNKGSSSLTVDARGLARPIDHIGVPFSTAPGANGADIGAVELEQGTPPNPTCETDPTLCPVVKPSNEFTFGKVKLNRKKGVATVQVKVPGAGKVLLLGSTTVAKSTKSANGKATLNLTVKAKGKAAKRLKKQGKAKVKASVRFAPTGGTAKTKSKTVKLVKKKKKRAGKS